MTMREPFAKLSGTLGYIEVAGCWLVPTTHTIWPSAFVSKINATHEARVKEAVREAVAERDDRIADLERVLNRTKATLEYVSGFTVKSGYIECHGDKCRQINCLSCGGDFAVSYEPNRIELSLAEINSVLGKGE